MNDNQSPEAVEARALQEDPIVMYLIVHESLNMGMGKTAAQCAHASQMLTLEYFDIKENQNKLEMKISSQVSILETEDSKVFHALNANQIYIFDEWLKS